MLLVAVCLQVAACVSHLRTSHPQDFAALELHEIDDRIEVRRNRIFLLMEEVGRALSC